MVLETNKQNEEKPAVEKKKYKLYLESWICGEGQDCDTDPLNCLGSGQTQLLNEEGNSCCLGQFVMQDGIAKEQILDKAVLTDVIGCPKTAVNQIFVKSVSAVKVYCRDTRLSGRCLDINDNTDTTVEEKIRLLTEELAKQNIELEVVGDLKKVRKDQGLV